MKIHENPPFTVTRESQLPCKLRFNSTPLLDSHPFFQFSPLWHKNNKYVNKCQPSAVSTQEARTAKKHKKPISPQTEATKPNLMLKLQLKLKLKPKPKPSLPCQTKVAAFLQTLSWVCLKRDALVILKFRFREIMFGLWAHILHTNRTKKTIYRD